VNARFDDHQPLRLKAWDLAMASDHSREEYVSRD
jgi:hypothetical protein